MAPVWEVGLEGSWQPFDLTAQTLLRAAARANLPRANLETQGRAYEVDFREMQQRNLATGKLRPIRAREAQAAKAQAPAPPVFSTTSEPREFQDDCILRVPKKLPNPLDPETCQLSRESHRRHVTALVGLALKVPAFEVFADRQPVEWGLTEVIEHSLIAQEPLPTSGPSGSWLQLTEGDSNGGGLGGWWKLVVLEPGQRQRAP
ncbi:unnamed protein product [Effrenium voratum]|nr:unnamed protein product [Effrenium voratum]